MHPIKRDHEHAGFSWYPSDKPGIFNPYNLSDRVSRKTWYENVTYPDMAREKALIKKRVKKVLIKPRHVHGGPNALFTVFGCPECHEDSK
jgi:hypothetical protein